MATLTNADLTAYKRDLRRRPAAVAEMRALNPSKAAWKAGMQTIEDKYNATRAAIKADVDAAVGVTISVALAKEFEDIWMKRRAGAI